MEISDAAKAGDGTTQNVGIKAGMKAQDHATSCNKMQDREI
jgi:hypothetical protein